MSSWKALLQVSDYKLFRFSETKRKPSIIRYSIPNPTSSLVESSDDDFPAKMETAGNRDEYCSLFNLKFNPFLPTQAIPFSPRMIWWLTAAVLLTYQLVIRRFFSRLFPLCHHRLPFREMSEVSLNSSVKNFLCKSTTPEEEENSERCLKIRRDEWRNRFQVKLKRIFTEKHMLKAANFLRKRLWL